jgi:NAD(P)H dehydrogenase (quinone)
VPWVRVRRIDAKLSRADCPSCPIQAFQLNPLVAVTGATGIVGGGVARRLAAAGIAQRLIVRSRNRTPLVPNSEVAVASYADFAGSRTALDGIDTVFMVSGAEDPDRLADHRTFIDAAAAAGVHRIVYTSFYGANASSTFLLGRDHWFTEEHLRASGLAFSFLRNNLYADQFLDWAGPEGLLAGPAGDGRVAVVSRTDVVDVAAVILRAAVTFGREASEHDGATYGLSGPAALSLTEIAATISEVTGHPTRYQPETLAEAYASRAMYDAPRWMVDAWVSTYTAIAAGELAEVTGDVQRLTGRPPMSYAELLGG